MRRCTTASAPRTTTDTRAGVTTKLVNAPAPLSTGMPANERSWMTLRSPETVTSLGAIRTTPSGAVSIGRLRVNGPVTLAISVGTVVTDSIAARARSDPTMRAMLGVMARPPCIW